MNLVRRLNSVQKCALKLIQNDACCFYSLLYAPRNIQSIVFLCTIPYIGVFVDGSRQWGDKVNALFPTFTKQEKAYYKFTRSCMKLFDDSFNTRLNNIMSTLAEHDNYFANICNPIAKRMKLYDNIGLYYINNHVIGNTIQLGEYYPTKRLQEIFNNNDLRIFDNTGSVIKEVSIVAGKLLAVFVSEEDTIRLNDIKITYRDYHLFSRCPLKHKDIYSVLLLNLLCAINYILYCIEALYTEEISTRLRLAYLMYYYVANTLPEINAVLSKSFYIDTRWINYSFRNCMAHYGLGLVMNEEDIIFDDEFFGLTIKFFSLKFIEFKLCIIHELESISNQLENYIFSDGT